MVTDVRIYDEKGKQELTFIMIADRQLSMFVLLIAYIAISDYQLSRYVCSEDCRLLTANFLHWSHRWHIADS